MKQHTMKIGIVMATIGVLAAVGTFSMSSASAAKAATETKKTDQKKTVKYVGSSEAKKYHKPSCEWVKKIRKSNLVEFASAAEAKKAGYTPCKVCLGMKETAGTSETKAVSAGQPNKADTKNTKTGY